MIPLLLGVLDSGKSGHLLTDDEQLIASVTVGAGGQTNIVFSSIPQTYNWLRLRLAHNYNGWVLMQLNGTLPVIMHRLWGDGSAVNTMNYSSGQNGAVATYSSAPGVGGSVTDIIDYASSAKCKTLRTLAGDDTDGGGSVEFMSNLWNYVSPVTSLTILGTFSAGSTFDLYGVK